LSRAPATAASGLQPQTIFLTKRVGEFKGKGPSAQVRPMPPHLPIVRNQKIAYIESLNFKKSKIFGQVE
jgi:hypothetical protein